MSKRVKTLSLWLLECRDGRIPYVTRLFTFYAESQTYASRYVADTLELQPHLVLVSLHEQPDGFIFFHYERPGQIEVEE
jgi:hypothetical protein